jgi:hypothetical protein
MLTLITWNIHCARTPDGAPLWRDARDMTAGGSDHPPLLLELT